MTHIIEFAPFKLKKGVSTSDFLLAQKELHQEYISKCKGFVSWKGLYQEGTDTWVDFLVWETRGDQEKASRGCHENALFQKYVSFIDENTIAFDGDFLYGIKADYSVFV